MVLYFDGHICLKQQNLQKQDIWSVYYSDPHRQLLKNLSTFQYQLEIYQYTVLKHCDGNSTNSLYYCHYNGCLLLAVLFWLDTRECLFTGWEENQAQVLTGSSCSEHDLS